MMSVLVSQQRISTCAGTVNKMKLIGSKKPLDIAFRNSIPSEDLSEKLAGSLYTNCLSLMDTFLKSEYRFHPPASGEVEQQPIQEARELTVVNKTCYLKNQGTRIRAASFAIRRTEYSIRSVKQTQHHHKSPLHVFPVSTFLRVLPDYIMCFFSCVLFFFSLLFMGTQDPIKNVNLNTKTAWA